MQSLFPAFLRLPYSKTLALEMVVPYTLRQGKLIKGHLDINHWQATRETMSCELGKCYPVYSVTIAGLRD